jgi:hypothetical protein
MPELDDDGGQVFDEWRAHYKPSVETLGYITAVLTGVAQGAWSGRWLSYPDESDHSITIIDPRDKLHICLRLWADEDQFTLVRIIDGDFD